MMPEPRRRSKQQQVGCLDWTLLPGQGRIPAGRHLATAAAHERVIRKPLWTAERAVDHRCYQRVARAREICARGGLKDVSGDPTTELGEEPAINRGAVELADVGIQAQITL